MQFGCSDPWVAITPGGHASRAVLGARVAGPAAGAEPLVHHSVDRGRTWDDAPESLGRGHDHPPLAIDSAPGARRRWLYSLSSQAIRADGGRRRFALGVARQRRDATALRAVPA